MATLTKFRGLALILSFSTAMLWAGVSFGQAKNPSDTNASTSGQATGPAAQAPAAQGQPMPPATLTALRPATKARPPTTRRNISTTAGQMTLTPLETVRSADAG